MGTRQALVDSELLSLSDRPAKTFVLGVGCQKGGTTWLHSQLARHPEVNFGFEKEYHIFDVLFLEECGIFLKRRLESLHQAVANRQSMSQGESPDKLFQIIDFYRDTSNYFNYFATLLEGHSAPRITGDVTPAYAGLPAAAFEQIRNQFEARGIRTKVVFLMRDPVDRIWSQIRMLRRDQADDTDIKRARDVRDALLLKYKWKTYEFRTRYEHTISNLEGVFSSEDIYYGFYETLFEPESMQRLAAFLGVQEIAAQFDQQINTSQAKQEDLDEEAWQEVATYYSDTYHYCDRKFGTKNFWPGYAYI